MGKPAYLQCHSSGMYYFRKRVPAEHQHIHGKEIKFSLHTRCPMTAEEEALKAQLAYIDKLKTGPKGIVTYNIPPTPVHEQAHGIIGKLYKGHAPFYLSYNDIDVAYLQSFKRKLRFDHTLHPDSYPLLEAAIDELIKGLHGQPYDAESVDENVCAALRMGVTALVSPASNASEKGKKLTIRDIEKEWLKSRSNISSKTVSDYHWAVQFFEEACGMVLLGDIGKEHLLQMKDYLCEKKESLEIVSSTINKHTQNLKNLFSYACKKLYVKSNPLTGFSVNVDFNDTTQVEPYTKEELKGLFLSEKFKSFKVQRPEFFWIPLVSLVTGMRLDEIGQLTREDIKQSDAIWYFDINQRTEGKKLKTKSSQRIVPVHHDLIKLGFIGYIDEIASTPEDFIFPQLEPYNGRRTHYFSKDFGRYKTKVGHKGRHKNFHSFRHTFKDMCRDAELGEEMHDALTGHAGKSIGRTYGTSFSLESRNKAMQKIQLPIDLLLL